MDHHAGVRGLWLACALTAGCSADLAADEHGSIEQELIAACSTNPLLTTHIGDVTIASQAEADEFVCIRRIFGDLTIADSEEFFIGLPNLRFVQGDVHIVLSSSNEDVPPDERQVREVSLPALSRIVGDLTLDYPGAAGGFYGAEIDFGLEALTSLVGDLTVNIDNFGANLSGLSSLPRIFGSLRVNVTTGDIAAFGFLDALSFVAGDVSFIEGHNTFGILNALEVIGGSLTLEGLLFVTSQDNFAALRVVGGNLVLRDVALGQPLPVPPPLFPALTWVGGVLELREVAVDGSLALTLGDGSELRAGALRIVASEFDDLTATSFRLFPFGFIRIADNPNLCESAAQAFIDAQRSAGFVGLATSSGNGAGVSCP